MSNFIENATIEFHNKDGDLPFPIVSESEDFGTLRIKMEKTEITKTPLFMLFTIDKTGSMEEYTKNGTKMNYLKQTFKNMLHYFSRQEVDIFIRVHSFNVEVDIDIETIKVTSENLAELCSKIMNIQGESSTNIEMALENAKQTLNEYSSANPGHQIAHIFMTDGNPTMGESNNEKLAELVDNQYVNIFVGYGLDHNAELMKKLSEHKNADYQFVDDMENTGLVYGESVHQLLYPALKNVEIIVKNGKIYDWETNEWSDNYDINVLVSETEKIYQIKKDKDEEDFKIEIYRRHEYENEYYLLDEVIPVPDLVDMETNQIEEVDLTKYMYRQKVQELLYFANNLSNGVVYHESKLKVNMKEVFKKMRVYMRENNLLDDPFMKLLCDDISVTYQNMGAVNGLPFIYNRHTSQGRQKSYNVRTTSNDDDHLLRSKHCRHPLFDTSSPPLERQFAVSTATFCRSITNDFGTMDEFDNNNNTEESTLSNTMIDDIEEDEDNLDNYVVSNDVTSCYSTPSVLATMRSFSQNL